MIIMATLCYLIKDDKILMLLRNKKKNDYHEGKWNGLGGKFIEAESPEECAKREIFEESGLNVLNLNLKGFITFPKFDKTNDWNVFVFTVDQFSGEIVESPEGHLEWVPVSKLFDLNLWEGDKIFLKWLFQDKFFSAKFTYIDGTFSNYTVNFY